VTIGRTPRKVEEIVLDGNSLASLSTTKAPQIVYDRRPYSALIAELRTTQNAHFNSSRGRTGRCVANRRQQFAGELPCDCSFQLAGIIDSQPGRTRCCVVFGMFLCQN